MFTLKLPWVDISQDKMTRFNPYSVVWLSLPWERSQGPPSHQLTKLAFTKPQFID